MWSLDIETNTICINLEKAKEIMWKSVLEGEVGIDLTKVDNTRKIAEFDAEAQAAIERVTYDHHMKMTGKPSSSDKVSHRFHVASPSFYVVTSDLRVGVPEAAAPKPGEN